MRNSKYFILVSLISLMYSTMAFSQSLTSNKSSVLVGETFTLTCSLGSAGAGHTVAFFADPQNGPLVSLGTRVADGSGVATLTVTALSGWVPQTSFQARDDSAPGQPTSNWVVVTVSTVNPILTSSKSSVLVGENITLTCSLGSGGAGHTVAFFADPQNEPLVSLSTST
ncbi:MAG: hypothetical protein KDI38_11735 [Calditrichaeota bacterium]|nr:hypothetical protein [Calditrichota bacterium]